MTAKKIIIILSEYNTIGRLSELVNCAKGKGLRGGFTLLMQSSEVELVAPGFHLGTGVTGQALWQIWSSEVTVE